MSATDGHVDPAPSVGFIGLGIMGKPMALNLLRAGHRLIVHSRTEGPVAELAAAGAARGESPAQVAAVADVIITMLPDTPDVETVVNGPNGLMSAVRPGTLVIDMSTIDPMASRRLGREFAEHGVAFIDAPVSGGQKGAIEATLSIMVGGEEADVERARPLFDVLGKTVIRIGGVGAGQVAKAANQLVVGLTIEAVAEALALAEAAGADPAIVRQALLGGFASSRILEVHGQRMLDRDFNPGFRVRLHLKDGRIIERLATEVGVGTPAFAVALERLAGLTETGQGELDHSALFLAATATDEAKA